MTFEIPAAAYDRYMGRYSTQLAPLFARFAGVTAGLRVLDVGCGTGALTVELARLVGETSVAAADPTTAFLEACRAKVPLADARVAPAENLPWPAQSFDVAAAQLAVSFMTDAPAAVREMQRVVRTSGTVATCMWESGEGMQLVHLFWQACQALDSTVAPREPSLPYRTEPELRSLWETAGLERIEVASLSVAIEYTSFEDFWASLLGAAGPVGAHLLKLTEPQRVSLRAQCWQRLAQPAAAFTLGARAWAVRGHNP